MFKLAGHLGWSVRQIETQMSAKELDEWIAYDRLDPIGGFRADLQTAHLLYATYGEGKTLADFLPVDPNPMTDEERQRQAIEKQKQAIKEDMHRMLIAWGGDVK